MTDAGAAAAALAIGAHALAAYIAALVVVVAATIAGFRFRRRRADRHRSTAADATFASVHLRFVLVAILVAVAVFLGLTVDASAIGTFDTTLAATLSRSLAPATLAAFATVTHLADERTLVVLTIAVALALCAFRAWPLAIGWPLCCAGNGLLNPALKHLFERVRPLHDAAYVTHSVYSFPSGHTSGAVVVWGLVAWLAIRRTPRHRHGAIVACAAALVFTIAASRVMLLVHWASDVVAGLASGTVWLALCVLALERLVRPVRLPIG